MEKDATRWSKRLLVPWLVLAAACGSPAERVVDVRSLRLSVVDARTGEPLPDVQVTYALATSRRRRPLRSVFRARAAEPAGRLVLVERRRTDRQGNVSFAIRGLPLRGDEAVEQELAFVNLGVDLDHPAARAALEARDAGRRRAPERYGDVPDDVHVAWSIREDSKRAEVYRPLAPGHRGALLVSVAEGDAPVHVDRAQPGDPFRVQWNSSSLQRPSDDVVVALEPAGS